MGTNIETSLKKRTIYFDRVFWQEGFALQVPRSLKESSETNSTLR